MNNTRVVILNEVKHLNCYVEWSEISPSQETYETIKSETLRYAQGDKLVG